MKNLKSKETKKMVSAIFYKHDFLGLRRMEAPADEYDGETEYFLNLLRFELFMRPDNIRFSKSDINTPKKRLDFTFEEILERICRTIDAYMSLDGSVCGLYSFNEGFIGYGDPRLNPVKRIKYIDFARDMYDYLITEKEVNLDPKTVDESHLMDVKDYLLEEIKDKGLELSDFGINSEKDFYKLTKEQLSVISEELSDPDPIFMNMENEEK